VAEAAPAAPAAPAPAAGPKAANDTLVMIADDSKVVRVKTNRLLMNNQFQVQQAEDGLDAVKQIADRMPDILITDVEMPGLNGFELTRHVRNSPLTAHIPVIMISAEESYGPKAAEAGVDILLCKPYADEVMIAHIQRFMREGRAKAA
jgi:CheY-like chemotaxis protein